MIKFCHISPTHYIQQFCAASTSNLALAHLASDKKYAKAIKGCTDVKKKLDEDGSLISENRLMILDNSAFEMYKAGREMFSSERLIDIALELGATHVIMSDYPDEEATKTINAAARMIPKIKEAGLKTFFVPQAKVGDIEGLIASFAWGLKHPDIDLVGASILAIPNAFGVEKNNQLQRFFSRWRFMQILEDRQILLNDGAWHPFEPKIHFLGMLDGPREIWLVEKFHRHINSWDSSAAVWGGLNGQLFDETPTGLRMGKFEEPVDFNYKINDDYLAEHRVAIAELNIYIINVMCERAGRHDRF